MFERHNALLYWNVPQLCLNFSPCYPSVRVKTLFVRVLADMCLQVIILHSSGSRSRPDMISPALVKASRLGVRESPDLAVDFVALRSKSGGERG